ncbi:hypothetical protein BOX15_Mlig014986g1, partial [Macrostomum lignano]
SPEMSGGKAASLAAIQKEKEQLVLEIQRLQSDIDKYEYELKNISIYLTPEEKKDPKEQLASRAKFKFNTKPQEGIAFMLENDLIPDDSPASIAKYLYSAKQLDKQVLGNYLGKADNAKILTEYADQFPFAGKSFMTALREFMFSFKMIGESQVIERTMEIFSAAYHRQNPDFPLTAEQLFILCYACMMLQTSLHNASAKRDKSLSTVEGFHSLLGRSDLKNLDRQFVKEIFDDIKAQPFVSDDAVDELGGIEPGAIEKSGYLQKQGGSVKSWKRRFFVLSSNHLSYYAEQRSKGKPKGSIPLQGLEVREADDGKYCFELVKPPGLDGRIKAWKESNSSRVASKHECYRFAATSVEEMEDWMNALRRSIESSDDSQV